MGIRSALIAIKLVSQQFALSNFACIVTVSDWVSLVLILKKHLISSIAISTDSFLSVQRSSSRAFAICSELLRSRPLPCCTGITASVCRPF